MIVKTEIAPLSQLPKTGCRYALTSARVKTPLILGVCALQHGQPARLRTARKRRIERRNLVFRQHEIAGRGVFAGMFRGRRLRNREHRSRTGEEAQRDLTRRRATRPPRAARPPAPP